MAGSREFSPRVRVALLLAGLSFLPAWIGLIQYLLKMGNAREGAWQLMAIGAGISIVATAVMASAPTSSGWRWLLLLIACDGVASLWMGVTQAGIFGNVGGFAAVANLGGWLIVLRVLIHQLRDRPLAREFRWVVLGQLAGAAIAGSFMVMHWPNRYLRTWTGWGGNYPAESITVLLVVTACVIGVWRLMMRVAIATGRVPAIGQPMPGNQPPARVTPRSG